MNHEQDSAKAPTTQLVPGLNMQVPTRIGLPLPTFTQSRTQYTELMECAQAMPERDNDAMIKNARAIGQILATTGLKETGGNDAYYRFNIGGSMIEGPTVGLMESLEKVWGCTATEITISDMSEHTVSFNCRFMDFKTGTMKTRPATMVIIPAPAKFDRNEEQRARWRSMQHEAAASKATRNILKHGLPAWFVASAMAAARENLLKEVLKGKPIAMVREETVAWWERHKITPHMLEWYLKVPMPQWAADQILDLRDLLAALKNKETTLDEVFAAYHEERAAAEKAKEKEPTPAAAPKALNPTPQQTGLDALGLDAEAPTTKETVPSRRRTTRPEEPGDEGPK